MKKMLSVLTLILSATFFAGCAANGDSDEDFETDDAEMSDEDVGSAASALTKTCAQWTPNLATCTNADRMCKDYDLTPLACETLTQCHKCGVLGEQDL